MAKIAGYEFLLNIFVEVATVVILEWFAKLLQNSLILASIAKKCLQEYPKKTKTMSPYKIKKKRKKISVNRNIARKNNKNSIKKEKSSFIFDLYLFHSMSRANLNKSERVGDKYYHSIKVHT